jgi:hypothetical protein
MQQLFEWLESTGLARTVGESVWITASLSALHALGFTLVMGTGVVLNLRAAGVVLPSVDLSEFTRLAPRLLLGGIAVSVLTGATLFAPRASYTALGGAFQLKMSLLVLATVFQLAAVALVLNRPASRAAWRRASGVVGLVLWLSLAVTACWFILFE